MIIEQNENTCLIRHLLVLFLCLCLCFSLFVFPVSADSSSSEFVGQPFNSGDEFLLYSYNDVSYYIHLVSGTEIYFLVRFDTNGVPVVYAASESRQNITYYRTDADYNVYTAYLTELYDSTNKLYFGGCTSIARRNADYFIPSFYYSSGSIEADFFRENVAPVIREYIDNPPGPAVDPHDLSFSLPAGNVMFLELSSSTSSIDLFQEMGVLSSLFSTNGNWWMPYDSYGFSNSLPSSSDRLSGSSISWGKSGNTNFLGQTTSASYSLSFSNPSSQYLWIQHLSASQDQYEEFSNPILIRASGILSYKVYPLDSGIISVDGQLSTGTIVGSGDSFTGSYDPDTQSWVTTNDSTGQAGAPSVGGDNIGSSALGSGGKTIFNFLQKIADDLSTFFRGAVGAVSTLVSSASDFFTSIGGLFSWLPSPVYSVLISALILAITIGVIKVFI